MTDIQHSCKNCGIHEEQFDDDQLDDEWSDGRTQREVNENLKENGKRPYCSRSCMMQKLGLY